MSSAWGIDEDTAIALVAGVIAAAALALALRGFSRRRIGIGAAWLAGAAAFGFVAWFFAAFQMRLF